MHEGGLQDRVLPSLPCKVFHLCPSCSQKRTLLFGEYADERLLLRLPHRQIVFTFPKVLRVFFRLDRGLFGEASRIAYRLIQDFYAACAGRRIQSAAVIAYASVADSVVFSPHLQHLRPCGSIPVPRP